MQWTETGIASSFKFINKLYETADKLNNYKSNNNEDVDVIDSLKGIINEVSENIENFQFNKSVAKIYEFVNILNLSAQFWKKNYLRKTLNGRWKNFR